MTVILALWLAYGCGNAMAQFRAVAYTRPPNGWLSLPWVALLGPIENLVIGFPRDGRIIWIWQLGKWRRGEL